ncbi:hypothetical protein B5M42_001545 [Paenibacillus athensensis]|uniref:hypothetical protein n=1 Tax=Paenibacillus athensensis TaxID=1967502 RepID=UPI001ADDBDFA|nr:hypothetical protein [Paenibacillus athensensis]MCD1257519.1 hypothetical protein [Paenibacillus athensensis]
MMKYGQEPAEHRFSLQVMEVETRGQWLDIYLRLIQEPDAPLPEELEDPGVLLICTRQGEPVQLVVQDGGCDCEFQLTPSEKERIESFAAEAPLVRQTMARNTASL